MAKRIAVLPRVPGWGLPGLKLPELPPVYVELPDEVVLNLEGVDVEPAFPLPKVVIRFSAPVANLKGDK